jgi:protein-S-isoprenylcysteine O-methyltransferase Ste14
MTLYSVVVFLWLGSELLVGVVSIIRAGAPQGRREDRLSGPALIFFLVLAVYLGIGVSRGAHWAAIGGGHDVAFALGIALALVGIAVRWYAVISLGRFFTTRVMTRADQTVVQKGPYRLVRHPSYTGALLTVLGILLCQANWLSLLCFVLALPGFAYRIHVEERALLSALGQPYRDYMRRTKRLVPFLV